MRESIRSKRERGPSKPGLNRLFALFLLVFLFFSFSCAPAGGGEVDGGNSTESLPVLPEEPLLEEDPSIDRGLPGSRSKRLTLALSDPEKLNLNPFAEGVGLFPVDPSGRRQPVYETLISYDPGSLDYKPLLAGKVSLKDDLISVELPPGRKWQDGFTLTAADLLFSIETHISFKTQAGILFETLISDLEIAGELSLRIQVKEEEINAGIRCMEALASALIVPKHLWEPFLINVLDPEQLSGQDIPRVGSGPWSLYREDEYALSLAAFPDGQDPVSGIKYLSILKYARQDLARRALLHADLDLILLDSSLESLVSGDWELVLGQDDPPILPLMSGEKWLGLTVNPYRQGVLELDAFRQLLSLAAEGELAGPILLSQDPGSFPSYTFTIPTLMAGLDDQKMESGSLRPDKEAIYSILADAGLVLNRDTGRLESKGNPLPSLELIYPEDYDHIERACQLYQESAGRLGIGISLRSLPQDEWRLLSSEGDYELAYTESSVNESPAGLSERLLSILSLDQEDGGQGLLLISSMGDAKSWEDIIETLEELGTWLIREGILIPLAAGPSEAGLWNPAKVENFDFKGIFPAGIQTESRGLRH